MFTIVLISMAGFPPAVGFYAKLLVLKSAIDVDLMWIAITAVVFAVIGAYYYLKVIKAIYFDKPEGEVDFIKSSSAELRWLLSVNALAVLVIGIFPNTLVQLCIEAFSIN